MNKRKSSQDKNLNTMKRSRKFIKLALLIGIQLQLILMCRLTYSEAFQLWPSKLSQKNQRQDERASAAPTTRHGVESGPQKTSTSSSTTPAPIELHFELNAEPPEAQQQPGDESSLGTKTLDGSLILEDLVNQFERKFSQMKRGAESSYEVGNSLRYEPEAPNRTSSSERHLAEIVVEPTSEIPLELLHVTSGASLKPAPNDSLVDLQQADQEDRHIQYDTMSSFDNNEILSSPPNETDLGVQNFTVLPLAQLRDSSNFTLEPIRVQSEQIVANNSHEDIARRVDDDSPGTDEAAQVVRSNNSLQVMPADGSQKEQQARQNWHQPRSMSNEGPRAPQHSKPPYASYNQFHQSRSEPGGPPLQLVTTNNHNNRTGLAGGAHNSSTSPQRAPNGAGTQSGRVPDAKLQNASELVNSINRISSHLAGEAARQQKESNATATTATSTTSTSSTTTSTARPPATADVIAQSYEFLRERQQAQQQQELERMAAKLTPVNDPVDLSPISSTSSSLEPSLSHSTDGHDHRTASRGISPSQFYFSQAPFGELEESRSPASAVDSSSNLQRLQNDRYSHAGSFFHDANHVSDQQLSEPANQLFVTRAESDQNLALKQLSTRATTSTNRPARVPEDLRPHDMDEAAAYSLASASASSLSLPFGAQMHRETLELVSNQIQQADQTSLVHQHKERSPNSLEQQQHRGGGASYAAMLLNVTAPMTLPVSATEAMEASLGADLAARQMMHQVGGGSSLGLAGSGAYLQDLQASHSHHQRPAVSASYRPSSHMAPHRDERPRGPAYSMPANSYWPRPESHTTATSGAEATFGGAGASLGSSVAGATTSTAAGLSALERERLRLGDLARTSASGQQASGFRSPFNHIGYLPKPDGLVPTNSAWFQTTSLPALSSYLSGPTSGRLSFNGDSTTQVPLVAQSASNSSHAAQANHGASAGQTAARNSTASQQESTSGNQANLVATTNGFLTGSVSANSSSSDSPIMSGSEQQAPQTSGQVQVSSSNASGQQQPAPAVSKRVFNLTRVEHISAECSNDLIRTVIIFNGTFKGIIYSSGYVRDPNCMYVNGTGKTRYDFSIRLNQCGTLGRQELHPSSRPNELNRRDQVMWNTLSIQYNPIVEQEWDEHFRVSCEYGGDFWKTISFSPFNVETNTGSPVVFTVDPPQCQMEILKGHGLVGPRQEAVTGPVTVGDPLTLLIHMKSEKAGYDILVKNCIAHNGGQQKMQLIDNSGCVVNERFISPFRGTYNDNDLKHVTLYSYLKAFRFTGSPVLYLECEVHMCQSACPPQMCYWRTLSKRSINETRLMSGDEEPLDNYGESQLDLSDGSQLDEDVRSFRYNLTASTSTSTTTSATTTTEPSAGRGRRRSRSMRQTSGANEEAVKAASENLSDRVSLFQALEVRQEREPANLPEAFSYDQLERRLEDERQLDQAMILCYQRPKVFAFLFTVASILLAAVGLTISCCLRASSLKRQARHQAAKSKRQQQFVSQALSLTSANLGYAPLNSYLSPSPSSGSSAPSASVLGASSCASSSQHSPTSSSCHYSPEVAGSDAKQSKLLASRLSSLAALMEQQQLKQADVAARKSSCQKQLIG